MIFLIQALIPSPGYKEVYVPGFQSNTGVGPKIAVMNESLSKLVLTWTLFVSKVVGRRNLIVAGECTVDL